MANNIVPGRNVAFSAVQADVSLDDITAITSENVLRIIQYEGTLAKTWRKSRLINALDTLTVRGKVIIHATQAIDLTGYVSTIIPGSQLLVMTDSDNAVLVDSEGNAIEAT